jgi:hypothetical protein
MYGKKKTKETNQYQSRSKIEMFCKLMKVLVFNCSIRIINFFLKWKSSHNIIMLLLSINLHWDWYLNMHKKERKINNIYRTYLSKLDSNHQY